MSSTSENESSEGIRSNVMSEASLENLKRFREEMIMNNKDFLSRSRDFELANLKKYAILANIKETEIFENDSEDMGVKEDLVLLNIK